MPYHVIRTQGTRRCTTHTFRTERAADRERDAWRDAGWDANTLPGRAPKPPCRRAHCARLDDHRH